MGTDYARVSKQLSALGHPIRLRLMSLFHAVDEPLCVCELSDGLAIPDYQTSRHLKALSDAGWVSSTRDGVWIYYRLAEGLSSVDLSSLLSPMASDLKRMKARLQQRKAGRCVIGPTKSGGDHAE